LENNHEFGRWNREGGHEQIVSELDALVDEAATLYVMKITRQSLPEIADAKLRVDFHGNGRAIDQPQRKHHLIIRKY
jgi:hypothetical protein